MLLAEKTTNHLAEVFVDKADRKLSIFHLFFSPQSETKEKFGGIFEETKRVVHSLPLALFILPPSVKTFRLRHFQLQRFFARALVGSALVKLKTKY